MKIRGNTVGTSMPRPDWNQNDPKKANYICNKPDVGGHMGSKENPHSVTAAQVGARPNTWTPTAEDVGAAPASHATDKNNPHGVTAAQVGAHPNTWMPSAADVGAATTQFVEDCLIDYVTTSEFEGGLDTKAPTGYGLGKNIGELSNVADANDCVKNGWYKLVIGTTNGIGAQGIMRVDAENGESIVQTAYSGHSTGSGMVIMQRIKFKGTWGEWEWVTPLCVSGVEYRTTQRFLGKPVYTRCYDCGATGNTDYTITTDINRYGAIVFQVAGDDASFALPVYYGNEGARNKWIEINANTAGKILIIIRSRTMDYANRATRVQIWYTK